jgi:hypothetical protein
VGHAPAPSGGTVDDDHTGHIGILSLQVLPEPTALLLLAAGVGALVGLHRLSRRRES